MASKSDVEREAESLRGRRTGVKYSDLAGSLKRADAEAVSHAGSHRTWKHPNLPDHLTLVDKGSGDVLPVYISKTRKFLLKIAETL